MHGTAMLGRRSKSDEKAYERYKDFSDEEDEEEEVYEEFNYRSKKCKTERKANKMIRSRKDNEMSEDEEEEEEIIENDDENQNNQNSHNQVNQNHVSHVMDDIKSSSNIIEFKATKPDNENLLKLFFVNADSKFPSLCPGCESVYEDGEEKEVFHVLRYTSEDDETKSELVFDVDSHPGSYERFRKKHKLKPSDRVRVTTHFRLSCCQDEKTNLIDVRDSQLAQMKGLRIFYKDELVRYYLDVSGAADEDIMRTVNRRMCVMLRWSYFNNNYHKGSSKTKLSDTSDFVEAPQPRGFKIKLRDYQLRSISWMQSIERVENDWDTNTIQHNLCKDDDKNYMKLKLGRSPFYVGLSGDMRMEESFMTSGVTSVPEVPLRFYGGILADDTGSGKTLTVLGLVCSSPLTAAGIRERRRRFPRTLHMHVECRGTIVICPANIHKQWLSETKKACPSMKVLGLSTILDHQKISWRDVMEADLVIVSYQFLVNPNYHKRVLSQRVSAEFEMRDHVNDRGRVVLEICQFHRAVLDEFHELESAKGSVMQFVSQSLRADFTWGLSGTYRPGRFLSVGLKYFPVPTRLSQVIRENESAAAECEFKYVKRNEPQLQLPPIVNETVWVDLSARELALLHCQGEANRRSTRDQIMFCSHYQLTATASIEPNSFVSIAVAEEKLREAKRKEVDSLTRSVASSEKRLENAELNEEQKRTVRNSLVLLRRQLGIAQGSYNYFESVFRAICNDAATADGSDNCSICHDTIPPADLAILPCSHLYCYACVEGAIKRNPKCPLCAQPLKQPTDILRINRSANRESNAEQDELKHLDTSKYSSKMVAVYRYITSLLGANDEGATTRPARIILFLQYGDLANFMSESLKQLGVKHVRVVGNVFQRQNAIAQFTESEDVRLIMLSSENSVSGINLTQATHIILMHPFWSDKGEDVDLAYEKQGISRAYRFGLQHPLKIVRFAVKGTVEEEITLRRQNLRL